MLDKRFRGAIGRACSGFGWVGVPNAARVGVRVVRAGRDGAGWAGQGRAGQVWVRTGSGGWRACRLGHRLAYINRLTTAAGGG